MVARAIQHEALHHCFTVVRYPLVFEVRDRDGAAIPTAPPVDGGEL